MRFAIGGVIVILGTLSAFAQSEQTVPSAPNKCANLAGKITATTSNSTPQLFINTAKGWTEIVYNFLGSDLTLDSYQGGKLSFIYVAPPSEVKARQFLSIRTIADAALHDRWVSLRRQLGEFQDSALLGAYQGYHQEGKPPVGTLLRFHKWPDGERSDSPEETRQSWAFLTDSDPARHRVLAISYRASDKPVCVPFFLGPNVATPGAEIEGDDEITILKDFTVEITEAKTASGKPGRTFKIHSEKAKVQ